METKHTQGKWHVSQELSYLIVETEDKYTTEEICKVKSKYHLEETNANAKLIASAPEMLEALIKLRSWAIAKGIDIDGKLIIDTDKVLKQATGK